MGVFLHMAQALQATNSDYSLNKLYWISGPGHQDGVLWEVDTDQT